MTDRYKAIEGSQSGHCCFDATVVDSESTSNVGPGDFDAVCECFTMEDAQKISTALNEVTR